MEALGSAGVLTGLSALSGGLAGLLADAPDDPVLLMGAMLLAWLPLCAVILAGLALVARVQVAFAHRRQRRPALVLAAPARSPLVTRRFITNPRRTNGPLAAARLVLALATVLVLTAVVLASSGPLLLASLRG